MAGPAPPELGPAVSSFGDVRAQAAGKLRAAGVADVTLDPAANVPMVLVDAITVTGTAGIGGWSGQMPVRIIVAPPGDAFALAALEERLELVLRTLGPARADLGVTGPTDRPTYTVTYPVDVPNPDC